LAPFAVRAVIEVDQMANETEVDAGEIIRRFQEALEILAKYGIEPTEEFKAAVEKIIKTLGPGQA
jgi:hypothetical protein